MISKRKLIEIESTVSDFFSEVNQGEGFGPLGYYRPDYWPQLNTMKSTVAAEHRANYLCTNKITEPFIEMLRPFTIVLSIKAALHTCRRLHYTPAQFREYVEPYMNEIIKRVNAPQEVIIPFLVKWISL